MKSTFFSLALTMLCAVVAHSSVIFVKAGAQGSGTSWIDALGDLQTALTLANPGDEIWVAEGKYLPVYCTYCDLFQRSVAFRIPDKVKMYGGFGGFETSLNQRKWYAHPTTLSGNIGTPDVSDNSFSVVITKNVSSETLIDGFVISDGYADGMEKEGSPMRSGGGWYNDGSGKGNSSNPSIRNCVFLNNYAIEGGALFNHGPGGECSPEVVNCSFVSNKAELGGGAWFNNVEKGFSKIKMKKGKFVNNESAFGGAVFIAGHFGDGIVEFSSTYFVNNKATAGSAIFSLGQPLKNQPEFFLCEFLNNLSKEGDDIYVAPGNQVPARLMNAIAVQASVKL